MKWQNDDRILIVGWTIPLRNIHIHNNILGKKGAPNIINKQSTRLWFSIHRDPFDTLYSNLLHLQNSRWEYKDKQQ